MLFDHICKSLDFKGVSLEEGLEGYFGNFGFVGWEGFYGFLRDIGFDF